MKIFGFMFPSTQSNHDLFLLKAFKRDNSILHFLLNECIHNLWINTHEQKHIYCFIYSTLSRGRALGHGGLSPYLIPFLSTPPGSPDSGGPALGTGGGRGSVRSPRGLRRWRGRLGGRRTPGGSAGLCRGGTGIT